MSSPFKNFLDLIALDQAIETVNKKCKKLDQEIQTLEKQEHTLQETLHVLKQKVISAQKRVDAQELEMRTFDTAEKEKKTKLEFVSNQKEYQSLKAEIEQIKKKQHVLEDSLLQAWDELEATKRECEGTEKKIVPEHAALVSQREQCVQEFQQLQDEMEKLIAQRPVKEAEVPAEWLEKYTMMRASVPDPVVPVLNGSCSACFYKIIEQDMQLLRKKKLLQCKDCYRFLYLELPGNEHEAIESL